MDHQINNFVNTIFRLSVRAQLSGWLWRLSQSGLRLSGSFILYLKTLGLVAEQNVNTFIKVVEENPDWNRCIDDNSLKLGRCVHACNDNEECEADCLSRFKTRQLNCPCEVSWGHWQIMIHNDILWRIQENCFAGLNLELVQDPKEEQELDWCW